MINSASNVALTKKTVFHKHHKTVAPTPIRLVKIPVNVKIFLPFPDQRERGGVKAVCIEESITGRFAYLLGIRRWRHVRHYNTFPRRHPFLQRLARTGTLAAPGRWAL